MDVIRIKTQVMDPSWFRTMLEGGLIDVAHELKNATQPNDLHDLMAQWSGRAIAMTGFTRNAHWQILPAELPMDQLSVALFSATDDFKHQFKLGTDRLRQSLEQLTSSPIFKTAQRKETLQFPTLHKLIASTEDKQLMRLKSTIDKVMGRWLCSACLLDMPEEVRALANAWPSALQQTFDLNVFGEGLSEYTIEPQAIERTKLKVNAFFVALQFSRTECMDILHEANPALVKSMGSFKMQGKQEKLALDNLHTVFASCCQPKAYAHALRLVIGLPNEVSEGSDASKIGRRDPMNENLLHARLVRQALTMLKPQSQPHHPYIAAHLSAGTYDLNPELSVPMAMACGMGHVLEHFRGRMPWDFLEWKHETASILDLPLGCRKSAMQTDNFDSDDQSYENAILTFLDMAIADGRADFAFRVLATGNDIKKNNANGTPNVQVVEPLASLAENGFTRVIVKFLENGLDPTSKVADNVPSVLETADIKTPEIAHLMRTYLNRRKVQGMLEEMTATSTASPSP